MNLKATSPLAEWLSYLENSHFKAIDLGLDRIKSVAEELDLLNPAPYVITVGAQMVKAQRAVCLKPFC